MIVKNLQKLVIFKLYTLLNILIIILILLYNYCYKIFFILNLGVIKKKTNLSLIK